MVRIGWDSSVAVRSRGAAGAASAQRIAVPVSSWCAGSGGRARVKGPRRPSGAGQGRGVLGASEAQGWSESGNVPPSVASQGTPVSMGPVIPPS
jgi:hypothetical protein